MDPTVPTATTLPQPEPGALPPSVFRSGRHLLLLRHGLPLPVDRCFRCNEPASATKRKNLSWHHPAVYIGLLGGLLPYIILALCLQQRATVEFGLCPKCNGRRTLWLGIWTVSTLSIIPLVALAVSMESGLPALVGAALFIAGLFGLLLCGRIGYPKYIDPARITLAGSGEAFRHQFPEA